MAPLKCYLDPPFPNQQKKNVVKIWPPLKKTFWIRAWVGTVKYVLAIQYFSYWTLQSGASFVEHFGYLFVFRVCLCNTALSVPWSLVVTCCEKANLLALLCVMFLVFSSLPFMVYLVRWGTWLVYLFPNFKMPVIRSGHVTVTNHTPTQTPAQTIFKERNSQTMVIPLRQFGFRHLFRC